ncbi:MAG: energy transducer TonB [Bacteroidetes bacterium]|nr:energy transducer TonB [Bacteroidota bacterium]
MKTAFKIITVFFLMSLSVAAQKDKKGKGKEKVDETIYTTVDQKAVFNEGDNALQNLLKKNALMPASLKEGTTLKCPVKLTIDENGKLTDAVIDGSASACGDCDKEAIRVSKALTGFTPAKLKGKTVKSYLVVNVDFAKEIKSDPDASTSRKKKMVWD